jgi:hypothetical protein
MRMGVCSVLIFLWSTIEFSADIETVNDVVRGSIVGAARQVMGTGGRMRNAVPWWTEECREGSCE